jgi:esterase/lipase superfamily enzyme
MHREIHHWYSPNLNKEMPLSAYGHYGPALLLIPTAAADYLEYERFGLLESIRSFIDSGKVKVMSIDSINRESWLSEDMPHALRARRHEEWNRYVFDEVVPFIRRHCSDETPIYPCGASFGALHAMNLFLKRPDLLQGAMAFSGVYNLMEYTKGYYDDLVYFNSPAHYVPQMNDHATLERIRAGKIVLATGSGAYEDPNASRMFGDVLQSKSISHLLSVWGPEWTHDWPTWKAMLPWILKDL